MLPLGKEHHRPLRESVGRFIDLYGDHLGLNKPEKAH